MVLDRTRVVSGAFSSTWNALNVGNVALGGYKLRYSYLQKEINFDAVGITPVDALFTGLIMLIDFVCMQYSSEAIASMAWFMGDSSAGRGKVNAAGFSLWDAAKPFIMTSCSSTNNPTAMTFYKTILAPNFEVVQEHSGVVEKVVPMRLIVFPIAYESDGSYSTPSRPIACTETMYFTETVGTL